MNPSFEAAIPGGMIRMTGTGGTRGMSFFERCLQVGPCNWMVGLMLHDQSLENTFEPRPDAPNRRREVRVPSEDELVIDWHLMPGQPGRYSIINESSNGCLIQSAVPLLEGMTGRVRTRLPAGTAGSVSVIVAWARLVKGRYHVGLRYFAPC